MNCPHCTQAVQADDKYCESCGRPLGLFVVADDFARGRALAADTTDRDLFTHTADSGRLAIASHRGRHHDENQDSVGFHAEEGRVAMALADGVSTSVHARAAADTAVAAALQCLRDEALRAQIPLAGRLKLAVERAHAAVMQLPNDPPSHSQLAEPQTTLALALIEQDEVGYAWVGDSRVYLITGANVEQLSVDDSYLAEQLAAGIPLEEVMNSPDAHCITQCLGMLDDKPEVHLGIRKISAGEHVLLCSDGFWNYAAQSHTLQGLLGVSDSEPELALVDHCKRLIAFANQKGGNDNITVALYRHES